MDKNEKHKLCRYPTRFVVTKTFKMSQENKKPTTI